MEQQLGTDIGWDTSPPLRDSGTHYCVVLIITTILTVLVVVVHQLGWIATHTSEKLERL